MSADEFDRYTLGKTLYFSDETGRYGGEEYFDRRVRWSFMDDECKERTWYASGRDICFVYGDKPEPQCWQFFVNGGGGLTATYSNDDSDTTLYEVTGDDEEMICLGPEVGV